VKCFDLSYKVTSDGKEFTLIGSAGASKLVRHVVYDEIHYLPPDHNITHERDFVTLRDRLESPPAIRYISD
jgi:hypothetical protein